MRPPNFSPQSIFSPDNAFAAAIAAVRYPNTDAGVSVVVVVADLAAGGVSESDTA